MRGLMFSVLALSWLGLVAGCQSCGSSGCSSGCGSGGCGAGGCGAGWRGLGSDACRSHGICDCEIDNHCATRSPWLHFSPVTLGTPVEALPSPLKELPKGKL